MIEGYESDYFYVDQVDDDEDYQGASSEALPDHGIFHLNLADAAFLISKCLFYEGKIATRKPKKENLFENDEELKLFLGKEIKEYLGFLVSSIDRGLLKTSIMQRRNEKIIPEKTYIKSKDMDTWLAERKLNLGNYYTFDYNNSESELFQIAEKEAYKAVVAERTKRKLGNIEGLKNKDFEKEYYNEVNKSTRMKQEIQHLKQQLEQDKNDSLKTIERKSLLGLVIGMAVDKFRYDPKMSKNPAVPNIQSALARQGIEMDEDTVRKYLKEAAALLPVEIKN